ncbi:DUF6980 family protein [Niallia sp. FSL M8-0099]|uniref:DUF6980 family protein n=1 Tax=Niallia sp. FSL M8-0099 TaxID=2954519 RepID=UPI004046FF38
MRKRKTHCCGGGWGIMQHSSVIFMKIPMTCPDKLILFDEKDHDYGLFIHDGGTSSIEIEFCPWCGSKLA